MHHFDRSKPPQASQMSHEFSEVEVAKPFHSSIPFQWNSPLIQNGNAQCLQQNVNLKRLLHAGRWWSL